MRLLTILLLFVGCTENRPQAVKESCGEISQIQVISETPIIEVRFKFGGDTPVHTFEWFIGSDTCKVGQIVCLR